MWRSLKQFLVFVLASFMVFALIGCDLLGEEDDDDDNSSVPRGAGQLVYQGETTTLTQLIFVDYGSSGGVYNIDILIASDNLNFDTETGSGRFVYLETFFSTSSVSAGTYDWSTTETAGTFSGASDISTVVNDVITRDDMTAGSYTIAISGSTYTINGSVTTDTGETASFSYEGPVTAVY